MPRTSKRQLAAAATVVVLLAGTVAAVAAGGSGTHRDARSRPARVHGVGARDLAAAAGYLGLSPVRLASELQAGRSLAEVADSTPGKSAAGLEAVLVAEKRSRLGALTDTVGRRVNGEVNRNAGARAAAKGRHTRAPASQVPPPERLQAFAAAYLGIPPLLLAQELRSGLTLGQIADATPGKSAVGLVGSIALARRERLAAAVAAGRLSPQQANALSSRLISRMTVAVKRRSPGTLAR
jgi:hypothetical protein